MEFMQVERHLPTCIRATLQITACFSHVDSRLPHKYFFFASHPILD
jgi:hypothetical protein